MARLECHLPASLVDYRRGARMRARDRSWLSGFASDLFGYLHSFIGAGFAEWLLTIICRLTPSKSQPVMSR